jgi:hypothetical protein
MSIRSTALTISHAMKAVAWSFIGLRGSKDSEQNAQKLNPLHVVAVALVFIFLFVGSLVLFVNWVVPK